MAKEAKKTRRSGVSDYLIVTDGGEVTIVATRAELVAAVTDAGVKNVQAIYRGTKLDFRLETSVKIGRPRETKPEQPKA